jgi:hypothetical protein
MNKAVFYFSFFIGLSFFFVHSANAQVYHVRQNGDPGATCDQIRSDSPAARHIQQAIDCVAQTGSGAGKEVRVFAGSYINFTVPTAASGSNGNYFLIRANPTGPRMGLYGPADGYEAAVITNTTAQIDLSSNLPSQGGTGPTSYIQLEGFEINANGFNGTDVGGPRDTPTDRHHIRIYNNEIYNAHTASQAVGGSFFELKGNWIHDCGVGHCIYYTGYLLSDITIDGNLFENNPTQYGIHVSNNHQCPVTACPDDDIRRVTISNNVIRGIANIALLCGVNSDCLVYNNLVYNNNQEGIFVTGKNAVVYNNTIYNNAGQGIIYDYVGSSAPVVRNNILYANGNNTPGGRSNCCIAPIASDNLLGINPNFVDASTDDFRLTSASSAAINQGTNLSSVFTTDITGASRTQWDIGAYKFGEPVTPPPLPQQTPLP